MKREKGMCAFLCVVYVLYACVCTCFYVCVYVCVRSTACMFLCVCMWECLFVCECVRSSIRVRACKSSSLHVCMLVDGTASEPMLQWYRSAPTVTTESLMIQGTAAPLLHENDAAGGITMCIPHQLPHPTSVTPMIVALPVN
jgi:hypothetical protein